MRSDTPQATRTADETNQNFEPAITQTTGQTTTLGQLVIDIYRNLLGCAQVHAFNLTL